MPNLVEVVEEEIRRTDYNGRIKVYKEIGYKHTNFAEIVVEYSKKPKSGVMERARIFRYICDRIKNRLNKSDLKVLPYKKSFDELDTKNLKRMHAKSLAKEEPREINFMTYYVGQGAFSPEVVRIREKY